MSARNKTCLARRKAHAHASRNAPATGSRPEIAMVAMLAPRRHVDAPGWLVGLVSGALRLAGFGRRPSSETLAFFVNLCLPESEQARNRTPLREDPNPA